MEYISRTKDLANIQELIKEFPVTAILGARQVGKSTLARQFKADYYFDLENPRDLAKFEEPQLVLENLTGLICIDEIQKRPDLFPLLRFLVDQNKDIKFLILGSASRDLLQQSSESLAGRITYYELAGFSLSDVLLNNDNTNDEILKKLWIRGAFPRSYLASSEKVSMNWRTQFIDTYLERDIPQLGITLPAPSLRRFWIMLSHYQGQLLNYQELARSFGVSDTTVRRYIDILEGTFMVRLLKPWYENLGKRLVKSPKLYIRDSGIFHGLQNISSMEDLETNPKLGASFEGFVIEQLITNLRIRDPYFYRTQAGTEIDLFWTQDSKRYGVEVKYTASPKITPSMRHALADLQLSKLFVVYCGNDMWPMSENIDAVPLKYVLNEEP